MHGIGLRRPYYNDVQRIQHHVDFVEIITENFMDFGGRNKKVLFDFLNRMPVIPHGVALSIGSPDALNTDYLQSLKKLLDTIKPPWLSDHLSYSSAFGVYYHDLLPLPFTEEAILHVVPKIQYVQDFLNMPLLLENPTYYAQMPGAEMNEAEFIYEVITRSGCGLLLDINNVYVNAVNHQQNPYDLLHKMPLKQVQQIHMAGHDASGEFLIDTHGAPILQEVFELYAHIKKLCPNAWTLLEWDHNLPTLDELLFEHDKLKTNILHDASTLTPTHHPATSGRCA